METQGKVLSVSLSEDRGLSKQARPAITLEQGRGVIGDIHSGELVKHRSRMASDPTKPNLRQVHLIHSELIDELQVRGFAIEPGSLGENVTTQYIALLDLPRGTKLSVGESALIEITGLRNPCAQLDQLYQGLMDAVLDRDATGRVVRKAGVMGIVLEGGVVRPGDTINVQLPERVQEPLEPV